jgi:hypothetical protein
MAGDWDKHRYSRDFEEVELLFWKAFLASIAEFIRRELMINTYILHISWLLIM